MSDTFADSPTHVRTALNGLTALSQTISSRDAQLSQLLANTRQVTTTLSGSNGAIDKLINDGNLLLTELANRRDDIHRLLTGTTALAEQLSGLVADNQNQLATALSKLDFVTDILQRYHQNLNESLKLAGPYFRLANNATGSGHWIDNYLCALVPENRDPCVPPTLPGGGG